MAYVPQQIPKEEENQFGRTDPTTAQPAAIEGGGSAGMGGGARGVPGVASSTQFGSNAAKLSDYLKANEDQVGQFGDQIAGDLSNRYNQAMGSIDQGANTFGQQVSAGVPGVDQSKVQSALQDPSAFAKDPNNVKQFQSWYNPQYGGPQNFEGSSTYANVNDQVNKAVQDASLVNSQSGLGTYLNNYMGANDSTEGMRILDTALLQRNPHSAQAISGAAAPFSNLNSYLTNTAQKENTDIANAKQRVAKSGADVQAQTKGVTDAFSQDLQNRVAQAQGGAQNMDTAFKQAILNGGQLTDAEKKLYGLNNWDQILQTEKNLSANTPFSDSQAKYGVKADLSPYFTQQNPQSLTNANVANADDYAREAALQQMTSGGFNILPDDVSQAGTAPKTLLNFNSQQAGQDLQSQLSGLDQQFINQYKNFDLGAGDMNYWMGEGTPANADTGATAVPKGVLRDPFQANSYQGLVDIYNRNPTLTNDLQKGVGTQLTDWLNLLHTNPTQGGATGTAKPGDANYVSPNLRTVQGPNGQGQQMWFNGSQWVTAPTEFRNMQNGGYTERFNYDTGKYEPVTTPGAGVVSGGGTSYVDPKTGQTDKAY